MKLGIMQPYFFPYIGYWQLINAVDKFVIYEDVNYIKHGWINRNKILVNGKEKLVNLQILNASQNKLINELELLGNLIYNEQLLKTIEYCYKKAPYYKIVFPIIEGVINQSEKNLAKYLEFSIRRVNDYLSVNTELIVSSKIKKNNSLRSQAKIIEICNVLGANEYINPIGGQDLYSHEEFAINGVNLMFLVTGITEYQQFNKEFVPGLSIIDVMMFNSKKAITKLLEKYKLV
jgi:hypothetical protein